MLKRMLFVCVFVCAACGGEAVPDEILLECVELSQSSCALVVLDEGGSGEDVELCQFEVTEQCFETSAD